MRLPQLHKHGRDWQVADTQLLLTCREDLPGHGWTVHPCFTYREWPPGSGRPLSAACRPDLTAARWIARHGLQHAQFTTRREALQTVAALLADDPLEPARQPARLRRVNSDQYESDDANISRVIDDAGQANWLITYREGQWYADTLRGAAAFLGSLRTSTSSV